MESGGERDGRGVGESRKPKTEIRKKSEIRSPERLADVLGGAPQVDARVGGAGSGDGEPVEVERDLAGTDGNRIAGADRNVCGQIIRTCTADGIGRGRNCRARLNLRERLHGRRGHARRGETALGKPGLHGEEQAADTGHENYGGSGFHNTTENAPARNVQLIFLNRINS